jgi:hypothetical protein
MMERSCARPAGFDRLIQAAFGAFAHRELTGCAKFRQPNDPRPNWFEHFQLSDCDLVDASRVASAGGRCGRQCK